MKDILTPDQVAEYLQLNVETVYRLIRQGKLGATRIGRSYRIARTDLETFLVTHSNRDEVRAGLWRRVMEIAERNPGVNSDDLLEEFEAMDRERKLARAHAG